MNVHIPNEPVPEIPAPVVRKSRGVSVIWTLPLLAIAICGWLLYQSRQNAGIEITIAFENGNGLVAGKTQVIANGIPVGLVKELHPDLLGKKVKAKVTMHKETAPYLVEDTLFWVVRPELSAARVVGLETILTGSYIGIRAGSSTTEKREFAGLDSIPPVSGSAPGLHIILEAAELGSIQVGTGVFFKNIEIGSVQSYHLEGAVDIAVFIKPEFAHLVHKQSRFCNASGISLSGKLTDIKLHVESLASLLRGGIHMQTPEPLKDSAVAENGQIFHLYKDYEDANYGIPMTLKLASGIDIAEGATKIMFQGLQAGFVKEIKIDKDDHRNITAHILIDPRAEGILKEKTVFWLVKPSITPAGVSNLQNLISGSYITFRPGDGAFCDQFTMLHEPPPQKPLRPGSTFQLTSKNGVSIQSGVPVYYKSIQVGEVIDADLMKGSNSVVASIFIYEPYTHLVSAKSIFWVQSGVELKADLSGVELKSGPLAQLLFGGIAFANPDKKDNRPGDQQAFVLHSDFREAVATHPELQQPGIHFRLLTDDPGSLTNGAPLLHKNIPIGRIEGFSFTKDRQKIIVDCFVNEQYQDLINDRSRFYRLNAIDFSGGIDGFSVKMGSMQTVIQGGIACITEPGGNAITSRTQLPLFASLDDALHQDMPELTLHFSQIRNLKVGSTLQYKGVKVGEVKSIRFGKELETITVQVRINKEIEPLFKTTTQVWLVEPEISLKGLRDTDSLLGSYITFLPGAGKPIKELTALSAPPQDRDPQAPGLTVILETTNLGSLTVGSPLYYRQMQIGEVRSFELSPSFQKVFVSVRIEPKFVPIVRTNTRFWNVSGVHVSGGIFSGVSINTDSLQSIVRGGIAMATPNTEEAGPPVAGGYHFSLHETMEKQWLDWNPDFVLIEAEKQQADPVKLRQ